MQWKSGDNSIFLATMLVFDLPRGAVMGPSPAQRCHRALGGILSLYSCAGISLCICFLLHRLGFFGKIYLIPSCCSDSLCHSPSCTPRGIYFCSGKVLQLNAGDGHGSSEKGRTEMRGWRAVLGVISATEPGRGLLRAQGGGSAGWEAEEQELRWRISFSFLFFNGELK